MRILKFGGTSLADAVQIQIVTGIIGRYHSEGHDLCIVVAALDGVTDQLLELCGLISGKSAGIEKVIPDLEQRHLNTLKALLPVSRQPAAMAEIMSMCNELSDITRGASLVGEVTPRTRDLILSFGERLSAYVIYQALQTAIAGVRYVDARELIRTDSSFGLAKVDFEVTNKLIQNYFSENDGLNVVTGFIASSLQGQTTTLGRSGSDYTSAILGAALLADAIEIWTHGDGVMTADPQYVKEAQSIGQLSYNEAMELSHFGTKVIFPAAMQPAMAGQIPILVKNMLKPFQKGTLICRDSVQDNGFIKGVASLKNICLINVEGSGMVGVAGVSARIFNALSKKHISVILISQASSEHSICIGLMKDDAETACQLLRQTFAVELAAGLISSIFFEDGLAIVAVVGENMRRTPGVSARVFGPLGRNGINVKAISQGSSELNISIVVQENDLKKALRILHQSFFSYDLIQLHLYIAGTGAIGSKLLQMIENQTEYLALQKISLKICGMINSRKMVISEDGIIPDHGSILTGWDSEPANLQHFIDKSIQQNLENSVFIDVTASEAPVRYYNELLSKNIAIVAANKRANTQSMEQYNLLQASARKRNTPFFYETNVGAGLPVINVLRSLLASGDKIIRIEAVLSGTMNYLLSEYNGDGLFSDLVRFARDQNYTEPDPRDDLSGMDVARKCLILSRECGSVIELEDVAVEPVMSAAAANAKDITEFFEELKNYNGVFHKRFEHARANGKRLRYVADIENGKAKVAVKEVDEYHPFYGLRGTENCISLTTNYYKQYPMVVKGPGAGVDVTSAGVLADIVRIAEGIKR